MYNSKFMEWLREGEDEPITLPFSNHPDYEKLPKCIQCFMSAREFSNLTDRERENLYETLCYPETD